VYRRTVLLAVVALALLAPAARGDVLIAESPCPAVGTAPPELLSGCTRVSAHGGRLVWSAYEPASSVYVLMTASRGVVAALPVPARAQPFDADLGEDSHGRTVATYSRCAGDPGGPAAGCVARELGFAPGAREHALLPGISADAPLVPSRWGERVAIAGDARAGNREAALCRAAGRPRCRTLPGGPMGVEPDKAGPMSIDVDAHRIAMGWFSQRDDAVRDRAILVARFSDRRATTIAKVGAGLGGDNAVHSPVLDGGYVYYARGGGNCGWRMDPTKVARYDLARRRPDEAPAPGLAGIAVDAGTIYYAACGGSPGPPGTAGSTLIQRADPAPFERPGAPDPSDAARCPAARPAPGWRTETIGRPSFAPFTVALLGTPSGAALALWPAAGSLELAARPAGGSFGTVRRVPGVAPFGAAWIAADGAGHVVAAWRANTGGGLVQASAGTIGGRFSAPQTLDADPARPYLLGVPVTAIAPDGTAVVVWTEPPPSPSGPGDFPHGTLLAAFRAPGAASFGAPIRLDSGPFGTQLHAVAATDGGRVLVLASGFVQGPHVVAIEATPAGFSAPVDLGARSGQLAQAWAALAPDGAATVAWSAGAAIQVVTRAPGGAFGPIATISTPRVPAGRRLGFAARGRRVALAWSETDAVRTVARLMVAEGSVGAALGRPQALTLLRGRMDEIGLALGDVGAASVAWRHPCRQGDGRVLAMTRRSAAARFGPVAVVSGRDRSARLPAVVLGRGGRPAVVWVAGPRAPKPAVVRAATR
jgi:hypothetical protein